MRRIFAAAMLSAAMAACTTLPYAVPVTDNGGSGDQRLAADPFDGIGDIARNGPTRVIWVHGMCTHSAEWADDRYGTLSAAIGAGPSRRTPGSTGKESVEPIVFESEVNGHPLEVTYLLWSPLTAKYKQRLYYDRSDQVEKGAFPYRRATLNRDLKSGLMNDCLVDAVAYAGPNGDPIRSSMRTEVCRALGGDPANGECLIQGDPGSGSTILVAESLGSKILFDAVRAIWSGSGPRARSQIEARLSTVQLVFMLANQVPLLDAADQPATDGNASAITSLTAGRETESSLVDFLNLPGIARDTSAQRAGFRAFDPVHVVAFTDPNDLLSYRLDPRLLNMPGVKVANIIVSNAPTYLGLFEMPDDAHCGYKWNPFVIGTVAEGFDGEKVETTSIALNKECGLTEGADGSSGG